MWMSAGIAFLGSSNVSAHFFFEIYKSRLTFSVRGGIDTTVSVCTVKRFGNEEKGFSLGSSAQNVRKPKQSTDGDILILQSE